MQSRSCQSMNNPLRFIEIQCRRVKKYLRETLSEVMVAKEKQYIELFDLCKKAAAMKQIVIASPAKDHKKITKK